MISQSVEQKGAHLVWPNARQSVPFSVRVVEPGKYDAHRHADIFNSVITDLVSPAQNAMNGLALQTAPHGPRRFDLITFPEAFISSDTLATAIEIVSDAGLKGCVHVGLRPPAQNESHLFSSAAVSELVATLLPLASRPKEDLGVFQAWLADQDPEDYFNIGCVFAVDADGQTRICLHPKLVRSRFEEHVTPDKHMREANLLTLITLQPKDKRFGSVTLQPLICSDALSVTTDGLGCSPMAAITQHAACFEGEVPNHVDIVSLATCTPQAVEQSLAEKPYRLWRNQFLDAFKNAAEAGDYARHHHAALILSNFLTTPGDGPGGLSGIFYPGKPGFKDEMDGLSISCWGRPKAGQGNNKWSGPDDHALGKWSSLGFVAGLNPYAASASATARILQFDINRLPREASRWAHGGSLVEMHVHVCVPDKGGALVIESRKDARA